MQLSYNDQIIGVVTQLLTQLEVSFTATSLRDDLETHPDFPSIYAVTGVLRERNIETAAVKLSADQLLTLDTPMLIFPAGEQQEPTLISRINDGYVTQHYPDGRVLVSTWADFKAIWSGVAVLSARTDTSGEVDYTANMKKGREQTYFYYGLAGLGLILAIGLFMSAPDVRQALLLGSFLVGLVLCSMLAMSSIQANSVVTRLCRAGKNTDCNSVLNSPAATLFGWLKVADAGLIYFATGLTALAFLYRNNQNPAHFLTLFAFISLLGLPYTVFSVVYQYRVVRQWCPLCLGVQGILWVNFSLLLPYLRLTELVVDIPVWITVAWFAGLCIALWLVIRKLLTASAKVKPLRNQLGKLRRDTAIFNALLNDQSPIQFQEVDNDITVGYTDAPLQITVVTDPHCAPCKTTHQFLKVLQAQFADSVRLSCILHTRHKDLSDERNQVAISILGLPIAQRHNALKSWFLTRNLAEWQSQLPQYDIKMGQYIFANHNSWCAFSGVDYTPAIYLNGRKLPDFYTLRNLAYHIGAMREELAN